MNPYFRNIRRSIEAGPVTKYVYPATKGGKLKPKPKKRVLNLVASIRGERPCDLESRLRRVILACDAIVMRSGDDVPDSSTFWGNSYWTSNVRPRGEGG